MKDATSAPDETSVKLLNVGLNRTGTTTLGLAVRTLGYTHLSFDEAACELYVDEKWDELIRRASQFEVLDDWPWLLMYEQFDGAHPTARFVMTRRTDRSRWYRSVCNHVDLIGPHWFYGFLVGDSDPRRVPDRCLEFHDSHQTAVRSYFAGRGDFRELCWEEGDAWAELCGFLGVATPDAPFPHANRLSSKPTLLRRSRLRARYLVREGRMNAAVRRRWEI